MSIQFKRHFGLIVALAVVAGLAIVVACDSERASSANRPAATATPLVRRGTATEAASAAAPAVTGASATQAATPTVRAVASATPEASQGDTGTSTQSSRTGVAIRLLGSSISVDGGGVAVDGSRATITRAGTYVVSGSVADGQIIVDADKQDVRLVLNGADIHCSNSAPIFVRDADRVTIELAAGTENSVTDGAAYVLEEGDEPNAAIFSRAGLGFEGGGTLTVAGSYNDGIASKDELVIAGGTIRVTAVDDGVRGKDSILIEGGDLTVEAGGDGLKSDHDQDAALGCISVMDGVLRITAGGDGFDAETEVRIAGGELTVTTGGGSKVRLYSDVSAKGIKGTARVSILGGTLVINSADDALHSNGAIVVSGGQLDIDTGDDGLHADATLEIHGGDIRIHSSYEGLESAVVTITGGNVHLAASDDGINIVGGNDGSGALPGGGGGRGRDNFAQSGNNRLYVRGGYVYIDAQGDGVDANGSIEMTDGVLLINGPTQSMNGALDFGTFNISGGTLVAVGSAGMAMAPSGTSTQPAVLINLNGWIRGGTLIHFQDRAGQDVLTFASAKDYQSIVVSSSRLTVGSTYSVFYQGSSTGAVTDGLYEGGEYSGGTELGSYTQSSVVTNLGGRARQGP